MANTNSKTNYTHYVPYSHSGQPIKVYPLIALTTYGSMPWVIYGAVDYSLNKPKSGADDYSLNKPRSGAVDDSLNKPKSLPLKH